MVTLKVKYILVGVALYLPSRLFSPLLRSSTSRDPLNKPSPSGFGET